MDLNLLPVFEALLEERNVSRAAARVGLTQPAMSNALRRLREALDDDLFVRTRGTMAPTARALEFGGPIRIALSQVRSAVAERPRFEAAVSARSFRLAMSDYAEFRLLGPLLRRAQRKAPEIQILVRRLERIFIAPEEELCAGAFDAAIGFFAEASALGPGTRSQDLFVEENVCIARRGNPVVKKPFTLRRFAGAGHVGVFYRNDTRGLIDSLLANHGLRRRLVATAPHFLSVPYVVAESDLIAVVPAGLAERHRKSLRLEVRKTPIALPPLRMRLLWHEHAEEDPAHVWLRAEIRESLRAARGAED